MITKLEVFPKEGGYSIYTVLNNKKGAIYEQHFEVINKEIIDWGCTCIFSSTYRFSEKHIEKGTKCKHAHEIICLLIYLGYLEETF